MNEVVRRLIKECMAEELAIDISEVNDDYDLFLVGIDSLNLVTLIVSLEEEFQIQFDSDLIDMDRFKTINSIVNTIQVVKGQSIAK